MKVDAPPRSEDLLADIDAASREQCAASGRLLRSISSLDETDPWPRDPGCSLEDYLAWRLGISQTAAHELTRVARALRVLPLISRPHAGGQISYEQLRPLTRFAAAETDEHWAEVAGATKVSRLYLLARRHEAAQRDRADRERRSRRLWMGWDDGRTSFLFEGSLPAEQGAAFEAAIRRCAERIEVEDDVEDRMGARQADALVELVTSSGDRAVQPTLVVHADAGVLAGVDEGLAETESGAQLSGEAVRRLLCEARVEWVMESRGRPVGQGRSSRYLTGSQLRILRFRDRTCRYAGCERTHWLKVHHLEHWSRGGRTDLDNVVLVCSRHHAALHEGGWRSSGSADADLRFHGPPGQRFTMRSVQERERISA